MKYFYSLAMEEWLKNPDNLDKWEGATGTKFTAQERRVCILNWIRGAMNQMSEEQKKDPKKYCYSYFLRCGILATLTGQLDDEIKPQSFPNFRLPRERLNAHTGEVLAAAAPPPLANDDDGDDDNDDRSVTESEYAEPSNAEERDALRRERVFDFDYCKKQLPVIQSNEKRVKDRKTAVWSILTREEVLASATPATSKKAAVPAIDNQGRLSTWFENHWIIRMHNEEGWVFGMITKINPNGVWQRGHAKGCNSTIAFQSGQYEGEGERCVLLNLEQYNTSKDITAEAGSWCIAVSTFPESAEINGFDVDQMGDVDLDV